MAGLDHRPVYRRAGYLGVVAAGGAGGTVSRFVITEGSTAVLSQLAAITIINVLGCLLLGILLAELAHAGSDRGRRRMLRLLLGTGFLGGFTTYSSLAVGIASDLRSGQTVMPIGYGVGSVILGVLAAVLGIWCARAFHHRRAGRARSMSDE